MPGGPGSTAVLPEATLAVPGMDNVLAQANTADIGTLALLALAVMGFIWSLVSIKRSSPTDRINDLIRQRDEARADLDDCRRIVRGLERTISKLENGK